MKTEPIGIGIIGAGFAAGLHARGYRHAAGLARVVAVAGRRRDTAQEFARQYGIPACYDSAAELLADPAVHVVDLAVPNNLHHTLALAALQAGKHVICEKPLTGFFGSGHTPRAEMLAEALRNADAMIEAAGAHGLQILYAENLVYAPAIEKARRLLEASGGALLDIRAEESHSGSHAAYAKSWRESGGGSLLRLGSHPIGVGLYLKRCEGLARYGRPILPVSVTGEVASLTRSAAFQSQKSSCLVSDWQDVEDWALATVIFDDGTRGVFLATDTLLGGLRDRIELSLSNARLVCDLTHNGPLQAYAPDTTVFGDEYIAEKVSTKAGWSYPSIDEEWSLGYPQELYDFVQAVREGRPARSDAALGRDVLRVIYGAYLSAEEGRRVTL